jgi:hypothetical protein
VSPRSPLGAAADYESGVGSQSDDSVTVGFPTPSPIPSMHAEPSAVAATDLANAGDGGGGGGGVQQDISVHAQDQAAAACAAQAAIMDSFSSDHRLAQALQDNPSPAKLSNEEELFTCPVCLKPAGPLGLSVQWCDEPPPCTLVTSCLCV